MRKLPFHQYVLGAAVLTLLALFVSSCSSSGASSAAALGVVGRVVVFGPDGPSSRPVALCAYDGETLFAFGEAEAVAEMYIRATGGAVFPPAGYGGGKALCRNRAQGFEWKGDASGPWPMQAASLLKPGEAEAWGVAWIEPAPAVVQE